MTPRPLGGVLPVIQTPFTDVGEIDYEVLDAEVRWLLELGADGLVVGMVSEVLRLSDRERTALITFLGDRAGSAQTHVVMSVGAESTRVALGNAQIAQDHGATAVMAIPPVSVALPDSEVREYYRALVAGLSIPVVVQDASGYVGAPLSIGVMAQLQAEFGERVLFKPEAQPIGQRLSQLREATDGSAQIFEGTGGLCLIDSMRRGIAGTMPGADVCWAIVEMWRAGCAGNFTRAYEVQGPLLGLLAVQTSLDSFIAVEKHLLVRQGVFRSATVRAPVGFTLDEETISEVNRLFDALCDVCGRPPSRPSGR